MPRSRRWWLVQGRYRLSGSLTRPGRFEPFSRSQCGIRCKRLHERVERFDVGSDPEHSGERGVNISILLRAECCSLLEQRECASHNGEIATDRVRKVTRSHDVRLKLLSVTYLYEMQLIDDIVQPFHF